jgi:protein-L-isoaspartate(D-aspartate) O-methyltransferase
MDKRILEVIGKVPRHFFLAPEFSEFAYRDQAFQIGCGQTISQPYTVAFQTQLLDVRPREKILEIGTGSGYQAAILLELGAKVFTIERQRELFDKADELLHKMNYDLKMLFGDGYRGWPVYAPFHKIIITCGAPEVPEALYEQLRPGGIMVVPVGEGDTQEMKRVIKLRNGERYEQNFGLFRFVPMLKDKV